MSGEAAVPTMSHDQESLMIEHGLQRIRGVLSPVVTPFLPDYAPDADRFIRHCRWLVSNHVGLAVFGTNSEGNSLSVEERMVLPDSLVEAGIKDTPVRMSIEFRS